MVAVLLVLVFHTLGWPRGGFVGVDVFFVISGFLITGNLLRTAQRTGNVSFKKFYWNRVRRIVPAATVVLLLTVITAAILFQSGRFRQVSLDALSAFFFMSNWRFALRGTDYFGEFELVSPVQHYWSLSIEEQFYFVWPALIFVLWLIGTRGARTAGQTMTLVRVVFITVVVGSFAWACLETISAPTWAYFNTFSRAWELALGAVLAASAGTLARIRTELKPWLSWAGLGLILAGALLIREGSAGFPAPWALLPVAGSAMVIAAGVGEEPARQLFLRNRVSVYVGDISYSLYLVHWPIIVFLGTISKPGTIAFSVAVLALSFGLAIASYHFVENPLRYIDRDKFRSGIGKLLDRRSKRSGEFLSLSSRYSAAAALGLVTLGLSAIALDPARYYHAQPRETAGSSTSAKASPARDSGLSATPATTNGPATAALQQEISAALAKADWPALDPSLDTMINDPIPTMATISGCGGLEPELDPGTCWFGSTTAPVRIFVLGNSIAQNYLVSLRAIAEGSGGKVQIMTEAMTGCNFVDVQIYNADERYLNACPARRERTVELINSIKPQVVLFAHNYTDKKVAGSDRVLSPTEWADSLRNYIERFRSSVGKVAFLAPAPGDEWIAHCFGTRAGRPTPAECVSKPNNIWSNMADSEKTLANSLGGVWVDSMPWFCNGDGQCPAFVETTPVKVDAAHMTDAYALKVVPAMREGLAKAGLLGPEQPAAPAGGAPGSATSTPPLNPDGSAPSPAAPLTPVAPGLPMSPVAPVTGGAPGSSFGPATVVPGAVAPGPADTSTQPAQSGYFGFRQRPNG